MHLVLEMRVSTCSQGDPHLGHSGRLLPPPPDSPPLSTVLSPPPALARARDCEKRRTWALACSPSPGHPAAVHPDVIRINNFL